MHHQLANWRCSISTFLTHKCNSNFKIQNLFGTFLFNLFLQGGYLYTLLYVMGFPYALASSVGLLVVCVSVWLSMVSIYLRIFYMRF